MLNKKTIILIVNDSYGVLQRITSLMTRRRFNIDSITVGPTEKKGLSRIVIVTQCSDNLAKQISNQVSKLIDVHQVKILNDSYFISGELAFIKIEADEDIQKEILTSLKSFDFKVLNASSSSTLIQTVETTENINDLLETLSSYNVSEVSRTGLTAISI